MEAYLVIMAGGIGSRFWPLSEKSLPKQFLDILRTNNSLIQNAFYRHLKIFDKEKVFVVTNQIYKDIVKEHLKEIKEENILCEPMRKNTAPCIAFAYKTIEKMDNEDAVMVVVPSDHYIENEILYLETLKKGIKFVKENDCLLTIGIEPTRPETRYGYIQIDLNNKQENVNFLKVKTFIEKPKRELAELFVKSNEFLWNSGIFLWKVRLIKEAYKKYAPEIFYLFEDLFSNEFNNEELLYVYSECPSISVDYAIIEKADNVWVIKGNFKWSDLGTWSSLFDFLPKDENNNIIRGGKVLLNNSNNNYIQLNEKTIAIINNVNNLIIVEKDNKLLISDITKEEELRDIISNLQ